MYHFIIKDGLGINVYDKDYAEIVLDMKIKALEKCGYELHLIAPNPNGLNNYNWIGIYKILKFRRMFTDKVRLVYKRKKELDIQTYTIEIYNIYKFIDGIFVPWF